MRFFVKTNIFKATTASAETLDLPKYKKITLNCSLNYTGYIISVLFFSTAPRVLARVTTEIGPLHSAGRRDYTQIGKNRRRRRRRLFRPVSTTQ